MVRIFIRMLQIFIRKLRIPFEWLNFHSNGSDPVLMVRTCFRMVESRSNGWNLHSNASNPCSNAYIWIYMNDSNFHSNSFNPVRLVGICIQILQIPFEMLEFAFECFESCSNGWNLHLNGSNPVRMVRICI